MAVFRVNKTKNYTVMSNYHFKEKEMSLKAKGLLSMMLSLRDDWDYSIAGLVKLSSDGESSVRTALNELEKFGYLKRTRTRKNGKLDDIIYDIFEEPQSDFLNVENLKQEKIILENQSQLNTNNIKYLKNNKNTKKGKSKKEKFLDSISNKLQEYDFKATVEEKILDFYEMWYDNKVVIPIQSIEAQLNLLATMNMNEQLNSINNSVKNGWRSLAYENSSKSRRGFVDTAPQDLKWNKEQRELHKNEKGMSF